MNKVSEKHIRLLILLAIALIFFSCYRFGYLRFEERANDIKEKNEVLTTRVNQLTILEKESDKYKKDIESSLVKINDIKEKYGPLNTPEKSLIFLVGLEKFAKLEIPSVSFGTDTEIFTSDTVPSTNGLGVSVYTSPLSISYRTTYEGLKECMDYINQYEERMNVESITASYDATTGNLTGTMVINLYAMSGTDKQYVKPEVAGIPIGTENIFGTAEIPIAPRE